MACKDNEKEMYISQIDSLILKLDSLDYIANNEEIQYSSSIQETVSATIESIKKNYKNDTIDFSLAENLDNYQEIGDALLVNSANLSKVKEVIPKIKDNLEKLRHDVKFGVNERSEYQTFVDEETEKVEDVKEVLTYYLNTKSEYESWYDSLHPIVHQFEQSLQSNINE
ncbi:MAG: hypothetical protein WC994_08455 [Brumimicrobium sp.]